MSSYRSIRLPSRTLQRYQLPDISYRIPKSEVDQLLAGSMDLPFKVMLEGLQEKSENLKKGWKQLEPAIETLSEILAPTHIPEIASVVGENWWLELGPVDLSDELVTIQRENHLIAAMTRRKDGRLRLAVYRPLDAGSVYTLATIGVNPHPDGTVAMRDNNWEYALDASASSIGQMMAAEAGRSYKSYWEKGLGISQDGSEIPEWLQQRELRCRPNHQVAVELGGRFLEYGQNNPEYLNPEVEEEGEVNTQIPKWKRKRQWKSTIQNRFLGCMLGGAVGDALGAPVEFMSHHEIRRKFGPRGLTDLAPAYGGIGKITDDTQMALFTAEGLLRAWSRFCNKGMGINFVGTTHFAYQRWLITQGIEPTRGYPQWIREGWLMEQPELHSQRGPGQTNLGALQQQNPSSPINNSKGCGAVMRMAPLGLFCWKLTEGPDPAMLNPAQTFDVGIELSALTHGHPSGFLTGGVLAVLIQALADGATLQDALFVAKGILRLRSDHEETLQAIEMAEQLAESDLAHHKAIRQLGEGWVAEEALAIAIYCSLVAKNFRHGVTIAVNHDGDSDSTGAITGNILGTLYGVKKIPAAWIERLELREVISEIAQDLYEFREWGIGMFGSATPEMFAKIRRKYPPK